MDENKKTLLQRFILWREKNIKEKQFVLILSFAVGVLTALAACLLKFLIEYVKEFLTENFDTTGANWLYLVYPVIGIFLTGLFIRYVVKDDISHGVTKILYAISRRQSRIKRHNIWSSLFASSITIGFGGSVGAEAPIVLTGSAIGSNLGSVFKMEHRTLMLLVGCGALDKDLDNERKVLSKLYEKLLNDNHPIEKWIYGHFHEHNVEVINNIEFTALINCDYNFDVKELNVY